MNFWIAVIPTLMPNLASAVAIEIDLEEPYPTPLPDPNLASAIAIDVDLK